MKKLMVFIPAFNESGSVAKVIKQIPKKIGGYQTQVLVVDDGSTDDTRKKSEATGAIVVSHAHNQGVGKAFHTGLETALEMGADALVNIDADGQFNPNEIKYLLKPIMEDRADFVCGNRFVEEKKPADMPPEKFWGNQLMTRFISYLAGQEFDDVSCGFRAYNKKAMLLLNLTGKFTYTQESFIDLSFKGARIIQIPVTVKYSKERVSKVANNLIKYGFKTLKIIIRTFRDYKPLLFFFHVSIVPLVLGILSGAYLILHYLQTGAFSPYKFLGFGSVYLLTLALLLWVAGFISDMFVRVRMNQERILYQQKKQSYEN